VNFIFFKSSEIRKLQNDVFEVEVVAERAQQLFSQHDLQVGVVSSCILQDLGCAKALVKQASPDKIRFEVSNAQPLLEPLSIDLAVAFARPQTLKKVLQISASFGVRSLSLIKTERVVASYLQSKVLGESELEDNFILGCQQSGSASYPEFKKFYSLESFIKGCSGRKNLFFGDLGPKPTAKEPLGQALLLIGPELGLLPEEKMALELAGFQALSLGPRVQRVEVALAALLGRIL
jgi:16S rRNA (uracil1498-N3)-methyltransferase